MLRAFIFVVSLLLALVATSRAGLQDQYQNSKLISNNPNIAIYWTLNTTAGTWSVAVDGPAASGSPYLAIGLSPTGGMIGSVAIIGFFQGSANVKYYLLNDQVEADINANPIDLLTSQSVTVSGGRVTVMFTRANFNTAPSFDPNSAYNMIWAVGSHSGTFVQQHFNRGTGPVINFSQASVIPSCTPSCGSHGTCSGVNVCTCLDGYSGPLCNVAPGADPLEGSFKFFYLASSSPFFKVYWTPDSNTGSISFAVKAATTGYAALGFSSDQLMLGSHAVAGYGSGNSFVVQEYILNSKTDGGSFVQYDELTSKNFSSANGLVTVMFSRKLVTPRNSISLSGSTNLLWAVGGVTTVLTKHSDKGTISCDLAGGTCSDVAQSKDVGAHGWLMTLAWGVLLPMGMFVARFEKKYDPQWFQFHQYCQTLGLVLFIAGFGVIVDYVRKVGSPHFNSGHSIIGIVIFISGIVQFFGGIFRAHKGTPNRPAWELFHRNLGRATIILGFINIYLGLNKYQAREVFWIVFSIWFAIYVAVFIFHEVRKRLNDAEKETLSDGQMK